ncbi:MAG: hypothetical protein ACOYL6_14530 [Bacteriovoracaceae bacterium]
MKSLILIAVLFSIHSFAGTHFAQSIYLQGSFNPDQAHVLALENFCQAETAKIADKMKTLAASHGIDSANLKVEAQIKKTTSDTTGDAYYCLASISGDSSKDVKVVELHERVSHLKNKGYSKEEFSAACAGYVQAFNANKDEIWLSEKVSKTIINGNFCDVKSFVIVSQN